MRNEFCCECELIRGKMREVNPLILRNKSDDGANDSWYGREHDESLFKRLHCACRARAK